MATTRDGPLEVWMVHPDLGIGGAERLVVNAALALQQRGHRVVLFTAHHDPARCFAETKPGGPLGDCVRVHGAWIPRTVFGRLHVLCAVLRMAWVALIIEILARVSRTPDVIVCDQVAHVVPLLQRGTGRAVVFYCHFPDKLLCVDRDSRAKRLYRRPVDALEERATGAADVVVVNSAFTASVFREAFASLGDVPLKVLYPAIDLEQFEASVEERSKATEELPARLREHLLHHMRDAVVLLSINRFERKKNILLAVQALAELRGIVNDELFAAMHLVLAGGYDSRLQENVEYMAELKEAVGSLGLVDKVSFLPSFSDEQKVVLVEMARCVIYTPDREHFGIVPIEAMYARCPVVAVNTGGPVETVSHGKTGFLEPQEPKAFARAICRLAKDEALAERMGQAGREAVLERFSLATFGDELDKILRAAAGPARASGLSPLLMLLGSLAVILSIAMAASW